MVSAAPNEKGGKLHSTITFRHEVKKPVQEAVTLKPISVEALREAIRNQGLICPNTVEAQALLESGRFTSFLFKKTNNLFGMRYPAQRKTTAIGLYLVKEGEFIKGDQKDIKKYAARPNYAVYETWEDAVEDYKIWQDYSFKVSEKYFTFLNKIYAEDTLYIQKVRRLAELREKEIEEGRAVN